MQSSSWENLPSNLVGRQVKFKVAQRVSMIHIGMITCPQSAVIEEKGANI